MERRFRVCSLQFVVICVNIYKEMQRDIYPPATYADDSCLRLYTDMPNPFPTLIPYAPNYKQMDVVELQHAVK
jgi:hypothetical protein